MSRLVSNWQHLRGISVEEWRLSIGTQLLPLSCRLSFSNFSVPLSILFIPIDVLLVVLHRQMFSRDMLMRGEFPHFGPMQVAVESCCSPNKSNRQLQEVSTFTSSSLESLNSLHHPGGNFLVQSDQKIFLHIFRHILAPCAKLPFNA